MLMYVQEELADVWKENIEDLKAGILEFEMVEEFFKKIKKL